MLTYKGKTYPFKVEGLSVGEVGVTKAEARGNVFSLKNVEDFSGIYRAAGVGGTAVKGGEATALQNEKGVVINLVSTVAGRKFNLSRVGLKVELKGQTPSSDSTPRRKKMLASDTSMKLF